LALQSIAEQSANADVKSKALQKLLTVVSADTNLLTLQMVFENSKLAEVKEAASNQLLHEIGESENLLGLMNLYVKHPSEQYGLNAKARAEELIAAWNKDRRDDKVGMLLATGYSHEVKGSDLAASAITAAKAIVKSSWENISQKEYRGNFIAPDGSVLPELMDMVKQRRSIPQNQSLLFNYLVENGNTQTIIIPSDPEDGIMTLTFNSNGLHYSRHEYEGRNFVYEIVTRTGSDGGASVTTEVVSLDGVLYRKSTVTGF
jgi:hypothetical protein